MVHLEANTPRGRNNKSNMSFPYDHNHNVSPASRDSNLPELSLQDTLVTTGQGSDTGSVAASEKRTDHVMDTVEGDHVAAGRGVSSSNVDVDSDPFDTTSPDWTYDRYLAALVAQGDGHGQLPPSYRMSLMFENLTVVGAGAGATYQHDVTASLMGPINAVRSLLSHKKEPEKTILHGVDGLVRDGEMLLVLGRPGSGCSTMLKNLAGFSEGYVRVDGDIKYSGIDLAIVKKYFRGEVAYNAEVEMHFPHLTAGQTLRTAVECRAPSSRRQGKLKSEYIDKTTDVLATTFGLRHALGTKVGDDFVRGVSGGERKRVSLAEVMACRTSMCCWDNPTRGLDASTSLEFATTLRNNCTLTHTTAVVAAYQAGENMTLLFDKVTILYLGRQIFFGTLLDAKAHFEGIGFVCRDRQTTADFLTAITDPQGRRVRPGWEAKAPRTPQEFVQFWKDSSYYTALQEDIKQYNAQYSNPETQLQAFKKLQGSQKNKSARMQSSYLASVPSQFATMIKRSTQRVLGDKAYIVAGSFSSIYMALILGSIFYNTPSNTSGFFSKGGVLFFSVLFNALQSMAEVGTQYAQRPIVEKQKGLRMYHPFVDSLATVVAEYPLKFTNVLIFDVVIYFMVGLKQEAGAFFIFLLVTYLTTILTSAMFRAIAACTKKSETASSIVGIMILVLSIYTGYVIPPPSMHPWFSWLRYINPVQYGFEALMVNEFHGKHGACTSLVPSGPGYEGVSIVNQVCSVVGSVTGQATVSGDAYVGDSFQYYHEHLWRNIGILVGFFVFFLILTAIAVELNPPEPSKGEFLVFRKGHEPEHVKKALDSGKAVDDVEVGSNEPVLTAVKTAVSEFQGLVQCEDLFTWEHLNYDITLGDGSTRRLLNDVSGYVRPGTLTALMGESGAGKTTLLNVLAQRVDTGVVTGDRLVSSYPTGNSFQRQTGYVQQQDVHVAESTVREALRFSALLRQPASVPVKEKYDYVETVINILEMEEYAEAVIGTPGHGLNVEQRKRTTIGIELVARPALLLFLDEPTSGLDSQSAWSIVRLLRKLANSGQAILCTIHQPSSVLFEQFDRLLLLQKGGRTVYFGNIGESSREVIAYFEAHNSPICQPEENPAEYILNVIGAGATAKKSQNFGDVWAQSEDAKRMVEDILRFKTEYKDSTNPGGDEGSDLTFAVPWVTQYKAVQMRVFQNYWRDPSYVNAKMLLNIVAGLFLGFTYWMSPNSVQGMQNKLFATFMAFIMAMSLMNQLQPRWEALCSLYSVREKPSKMYHWSTFVLSNVLAEIPYNIVGGTLFFIPWYFVIGFEKGMAHDHQNLRGFYEWLMIMLFQLWWSTFGQMIAAASPNAQTAAVLTTVTSSFVINFCGVLQPIFALIKFWHWMYYLSPYTWLIAGVMENSLGGIEVTCSAKELVSFNPPSGQTCLQYAGVFVEAAGKLINPSATAACQYCKYSSGDQYLATVNMRYSDRWRNLGFICAYIIFNIALTLLLFYLTKIANLNIGAKFMSKKKEKQQQHQDAKKSDKKSPRSLLPIAEPKPQVQDSSDDGAMETNVMGVRSEK